MGRDYHISQVENGYIVYREWPSLKIGEATHVFQSPKGLTDWLLKELVKEVD